MNTIRTSFSAQSFRDILDTTFLIKWEKNTILEVSGVETSDLLHRLSTNDILGVAPGGTVGSCFLTEKGRLVDYVNILVRGGKALLVTSPGNAGRFSDWIERFIIMEEVTVRDRSDDLNGYSILGPGAADVVSGTFGILLVAWQHTDVVVDGEPLIVSRRGMRETDRFDILVPAGGSTSIGMLSGAVPLHDQTLEELLRIWKGIPGYGSEISELYNPYETGYSAFLNGRKGCYIGQEVIARLATYDKIQKTLTGVLLSEKSPVSTPRELYVGGQPVGFLTSASTIAVAEYFPGLAVVKRNIVESGVRVSLSMEDSLSGVVITPLPFSLDLLTTPPDQHVRSSPGISR